MTIMVEITSRTGARAYKEYDAPSAYAAIDAANRELLAYPGFRVTGFWVDREREVQRKLKEEELAAAISDRSSPRRATLAGQSFDARSFPARFCQRLIRADGH